MQRDKKVIIVGCIDDPALLAKAKAMAEEAYGLEVVFEDVDAIIDESRVELKRMTVDEIFEATLVERNEEYPTGATKRRDRRKLMRKKSGGSYGR